MEFNKTTRGVLGFGLLAILIFAPLRVEIGYPGLYYACMALLAIVCVFFLVGEKKIEERFFRSWERKKSWPKPLVVLIEAVKSLIAMVAIVAFGQIVVNGSGVRELMDSLPFGARAGIAAMLIAFSIVFGFVRLYENNRRFDRLYARFYP